MRKLVTLFMCLVVSLLQLQAQNRTLTGKITDEKGNPVAGASVLVKGTTTGTTSKEDGTYSISVAAGAKSLVISALNLGTKEIKVEKSNIINVSLNSKIESLDDVVVTGYSREKKTQFAGAASTISGKVVEAVPVGSFDQALQGRVPGMLVNSSSGQPGTSATITIRGIQSITGAGAQPLFILDGVPMPSGDMQTINPNDFESITVLKDANAAALYGARGGTGVIVITSKRGKAGVTNFNYKSQYGFTQAPNFSRMNLMSTKEMLAYEERTKTAGTPGWTYSPLNPAIPAGMNAFRKQAILDSISAIDINYADLFFRQGFSSSQELSLSGGSDRTRYYLGGGYFSQEGIDLGSSLKRYTLRFNLDQTYNKLTVQLNSTVGYSKSKFAEGEVLGGGTRSPFEMIFRAKTYENPYKPDGTLNFGSSTNLALKQVANLLEGIQNSKRNTDQLKINAAINIAYKLTNDITLRNILGVDFSSNYNNRYINANSYVGQLQSFGNSGLVQEGYNAYSQLVNTSSAIFAKKFGKHDLETGAYFETVQGFNRGLGFTLYNLDARLTETGQGAGEILTNGATTYPQRATSAKSSFGIRSYFATAKYTFNNKYSLNANIRRDGTSRIVNINNREITTWSAGLIWNVLQESFLANQRIFNDLKLRASYGVVPNIGSIPTSSYGTYLGSLANYQGPQVPTFGTTSYAGSSVTGLIPSGSGNPDLKIEKIQKLNIGADFALWQNRARFTVDVYQNKTIDLFVEQPLSGTTGFTKLDVNAGIMTNKGFEASVKVDVIRSKDYGITLGWNHSMNKNTIEDLGLVNEYFLGTFVIRKGLPYGSHYTFNYLGADPATGRPMFEGPDGKTVYDPAVAGRFAKFGTYLPKHVGGVDFEIRVKRFTFAGLFSYQFDVVRSNNTRNWITNPFYAGIVRLSRELIDNQWQKPGDVKLFESSASYSRGFTSSDLENAKFLRLRNLMVSYQLPEFRNASGATLIKGGRFYVQGQNLAIWSPWRGLDPEDGNNISLREYPNPSMMVVGLDFNF